MSRLKYLNIVLLTNVGTFVYCQDSTIIEYKKFYYDNGAILSEGTMRNGKPDGYWKTYYKTGFLKSEGNRKDFQLDGVWKFYNEDGFLVSSIEYKNGKKNGIKNTYNNRGIIEISETYENDLKHGYTYYFYGTDSISKKIPFEKGREHGIGYEYDKQKNIISIITYKNGFIVKNEKINRTDERGKKQGIWKTFFEDMLVHTECNYVDDKLNGYFKEYNKNGELVKITKYIDGKEVTEAKEIAKLEVNVIEYYDNGKPKTVVTSKNGLKEGIERSYNEEGKIIASKTFKDGILVSKGIVDEAGMNQGYFEEYYPDGTLKSKGEYKDNKKIGLWVYYFPNGVEEQKGEYKNGVPDGDWYWYYPNKQLKRKEKFVKGKEEGDYVEYDEEGNVLTKGKFFEGLEDGEWLFEYGDFKEIGNFKEGNKVGEWKGYFKTNGNIAYKINYVDGNENGKFVFYYENGSPRIEGNYVMGLKEGIWKYYNENGLLILTENYINDVLVKIDGTKVRNISE